LGNQSNDNIRNTVSWASSVSFSFLEIKLNVGSQLRDFLAKPSDDHHMSDFLTVVIRMVFAPFSQVFNVFVIHFCSLLDSFFPDCNSRGREDTVSFLLLIRLIILWTFWGVQPRTRAISFMDGNRPKDFSSPPIASNNRI